MVDSISKKYIRIDKKILEFDFQKERVIGKISANKFRSPCILNSTATLIWDGLKKSCTVRDLATTLKERFSIDEKRAIDDVKRIVGILLKKKFVKGCIEE